MHIRPFLLRRRTLRCRVGGPALALQAIASFALVWSGLARSQALAGELGANSAIPRQYLAARRSPGHRRVELAMAKKAIADAHDAGFRFLRGAVAGYWPLNFGDRRNDLALWQRDPRAYWAALDRMFDDLDRAGLRFVPTFLWQESQFAVLGHDTLNKFVTDPQSRSRQLFAEYLRQFIGRYKARPTILFYELTNEMNLLADLDLRRRCPAGGRRPCVWDHFSTAEMDRFARQSVALIRRLDPSRQVSSGYSIPRRAAWHLMRRPAFAPGGPDWTPDTRGEFRRYLVRIHEPFDIISVHIYPRSQNDRFGRPPGEAYKLVGDAAAAAATAGKPLFVGEFGDRGLTPFMTQMLAALVRYKVPYSAVWTWEFYQTSTYRTHDTPATRFSLEPGYADRAIALFRKTERDLGSPPPPPASAPRVVLTWPLPCAAIDRPIELHAVASAGAGRVKKVEFFVNGKKIASTMQYPYTARFDPAGLGRKRVEIEARAVAPSGASASFKSPVRLNGAGISCDPTEAR